MGQILENIPAVVVNYDDIDGSGLIKLLDGPLANHCFKVHGSAFGGDKDFGQGTSFLASKGRLVTVKIDMGPDYIKIIEMKKRNLIQKRDK